MSNFLPGRLKYVVGDATVPESGGHRLIIHICNDVGGWGLGFVVALSKRWKKPEEEYRRWFRSKNNFKLGEIQLVEVQSDTTVINMLAQHKIISHDSSVPPLSYEALEKCLDKVVLLAKSHGASVHAPRIGAGLAGGEWNKIEELLVKKVVQAGVNVTIYDLSGPAASS